MKCPHCAEEIKDEAIKCRHCGEIPVEHSWIDFYSRYQAAAPKERVSLVHDLTPTQTVEFKRIKPTLDRSNLSTPAPAAPPIQDRPTGESSANVLAGIASFFIPGLGQLVQGKLGQAIAWFLCAMFLWAIFLGWIVHLLSAWDAAKGGVQWRPVG